MQKVQLRFVKDPLIREALEVEMKLFVLSLFFFLRIELVLRRVFLFVIPVLKQGLKTESSIFWIFFFFRIRTKVLGFLDINFVLERYCNIVYFICDSLEGFWRRE